MRTGYMLAMQNSHEGMSDAEMIRNELRIAAQFIKKMGIEGAVNDYISHQVWGTPQQIFDKLEARQRVIGEFEWNLVMSFGGIPFDVVEASTRLISQEVLPELRTWSEGTGAVIPEKCLKS